MSVPVFFASPLDKKAITRFTWFFSWQIHPSLSRCPKKDKYLQASRLLTALCPGEALILVALECRQVMQPVTPYKSKGEFLARVKTHIIDKKGVNFSKKLVCGKTST